MTIFANHALRLTRLILIGMLAIWATIAIFDWFNDRAAVQEDELRKATESALAIARKTRAAYEAQSKSSQIADSIVAVSVAKQERAEREALKARRRADSLSRGQAPIVSDTTAYRWYTAYSERTIEADSLKSALSQVKDQKSILEMDRNRWRNVADDLKANQADLVKVVEGLQKQNRCRIIFIPCPSRKMVAVGGLAIGVFGGAMIARRW